MTSSVFSWECHNNTGVRQLQWLICLVSLLAEEEAAEESEEESSEQEEEEENSEEEEGKAVCVWMCARVSLCVLIVPSVGETPAGLHATCA